MKPNSESQGGGMSRAAKKRAKKNKKKTDSKRLVEAANENLDSMDPTLTKKAKLNEGKEKSDKKVVKEKPMKDSVPDSDDEKKMDISSNDMVDMELPVFPGAALTEILLLKDPKDAERAEKMKNLSTEDRAACLFQAIIDPIPLQQFYKEYWEKKPLLVRAKNKKRYADLLSLESIKKMTKKHPLYYGRDLNVTRYQKGKDGVKRRITLDKTPGDANEEESGAPVDRAELWSNYDKGCTIRLLCPHKYEDNIQSLLSTLETELHCMVGANAYLTPPKSSQGFAPHYDDIEAFCLQLQGSKRWKVYEPTFKLPRVSSEDFTPEDLRDSEPVMDITLEEGDLLYMPRGWIHQACTLKDDKMHSLHLTVSAMQQWAWVDLLEMVIPDAVQAAAENESSTSLRQGLPRGFLDYMGAMYEEVKDEKLPESLKKVGEEEAMENIQIQERRILQERFRAEAKKRIMKVAKQAYEMIDAACDQMGKRFMIDRQPPALTKAEKSLTAQEDGGNPDAEILPNTRCRLARPGIARLVIEDGKAVVYHCADNSRVFHGQPISPLEFEMDDGAALEQLLTTAEPGWILVNDLFHDTIEDKIAIAQSLYDEGILAVINEE